jgi:hypothetical protein
MTTDTPVQTQSSDAKPAKRIVSGETVVGYAVLGCLVAGTLGIFKAVEVRGIDAAVCLLSAVAAFGTTCYIYLRRD